MIPISPKYDIGAKSYGRSTLAYQNSPPKVDLTLFKFYRNFGHFLLYYGREYVYIYMYMSSKTHFHHQSLRKNKP